jgi:transposase InsO family protein
MVKLPDKVLSEFVEERLGKTCPPENARKKLLEQAHILGHFGGEQTFRKLWDAGHYWPRMCQEAFAYVQACAECIKFNVRKSGFHPMQSVVAQYPFDHVAIDMASLPTNEGFCAVFVLVDMSTRYTVLRAVQDKKAVTIARCLWEVISTFGVPKIIQSDNGPEFVSQVVRALGQVLGIDHRLVAPYNPRAKRSGEIRAHIQDLTA